MATRNTDGVLIVATNEEGKVSFGLGRTPTTANTYAEGCVIISAGKVYYNSGTLASPTWNDVNTVDTAEVTDAAITPAKTNVATSVTATDDGTGTGVISESATHVTVTSAAGTKQVTLPSGAAANVGKKLTIWVGANGFELITPASSNATINNLDSDGTNQADIAADTLSELFLVAADTWILRNSTNLGAVATAIIPDND